MRAFPTVVSFLLFLFLFVLIFCIFSCLFLKTGKDIVKRRKSLIHFQTSVRENVFLEFEDNILAFALWQNLHTYCTFKSKNKLCLL